MSQALQEYPQMAQYYKITHNLLTEGAGERVRMLARLGYAKAKGSASRWLLDIKLKQ
jgi:hypothetical protein